LSFEAAQEAYEKGNLEEARRIITEVLSDEPNNASAWLLQMQVAEQDFERAAAMQRVLELNPAHPIALQYQEELSIEGAPSVEAEVDSEPAPPPGESTYAADGTRNSDLGTYEMLWDCEFCGTKKLLGKTHRFCGNCGAQQNPNKRYFPSDEDKIRVEDHIFVGVDVTCSTCQSLNSAAAEFCTNCATSLKEHGVQAARLGEQTRGMGEKFESGGARDLVKEDFEQAQPPAKKGRRILGLPAAVTGGIALVSAICIGILGVLFFSTEEATVTVVGHVWEREIQIEDFQARSEGDWCDSVPGDAYDISRSERQRSTRRVQDGETCSVRRIDNGDGTFSEREECRPTYRNEPVYDTYCDFTIDRWAVARSAIASGDSLSDALSWPSLNLIARSGIGAEREGDREERYIVQFHRSDADDTYECTFDSENRWREFAPNSVWTIEVGRVVGDARCGSLAPAG
jgi:hypothetical protein